MISGPEEWRPVPGHEGYEVSNRGQVRSWRPQGSRDPSKRRSSPHLLKPWPRNGYLQVKVGRGQHKKIHCLVAEVFIGPRPPGYDVAHGDGNRLNCAVDNLRYATRRENMADAIRHNTTTRGERQANSKLTAADVLKIRQLCREGHKKGAVATQFGIAATTLSNILAGRIWYWLEAEVVPIALRRASGGTGNAGAGHVRGAPPAANNESEKP